MEKQSYLRKWNDHIFGSGNYDEFMEREVHMMKQSYLKRIADGLFKKRLRSR